MATLDYSKTYRFATGFALRREAFGGVLCHFEGTKPDPRLYFVDSPFVMGLLELIEEGPLGDLFSQVADHFALDGAELDRVRDFFATLAQRGALVPK